MNYAVPCGAEPPLCELYGTAEAVSLQGWKRPAAADCTATSWQGDLR